MTNTITLTGCAPEPLGSYLTGLGVLRLLGSQADPSATGRWSEGGFVINTRLSPAELEDFLLNTYRPTPMLAPWNKGSGFRRDGKSTTAPERVQSVERSTAPRFSDLRRATAVARQIVDEYPDDKSFERSKDEIISRCRSEMPDTALDCIDASVALTQNGPVYPYILGTGFNLGRMELTDNYLGHLDSALGLNTAAHPESPRWLQDTLYGSESAALAKAAAGQFTPGLAGGANMSGSDEGQKLVNPWRFVLQLEGTMLFTSSVAKRLGSWTDSVAAKPFATRAAPSGSLHLSAAESPKEELWLPLWETPATLPEIKRLFSEARMRWHDRPVTRAVDAGRSVATLGVDRGIAAFTRTVIVDRLGRSPLAVPAGRQRVGYHPAVAHTADLDPWINRVRRFSGLPTRVRNLLRQIDDALFACVSADAATIDALTSLLLLASETESAIRNNQKLRNELPPVPNLDAATWLPALDDGSVEFTVAWGLAAAHEAPNDARRKSERSTYPTIWRPSVREYVRGVHTTPRRTIEWVDGPEIGINLERSLVGSMAAMHVAHATNPSVMADVTGEITSMAEMAWLPAETIEGLVTGRLDEIAIARFTRVLALVEPAPEPLAPRPASSPPAPAWRLLVPLFQGHVPAATSREPLLADRAWPAMLRRGAVEPVLQAAIGRLRSRVGHVRVAASELARTADGERLAAALFLRPPPAVMTRFLASYIDQPHEQEETP